MHQRPSYPTQIPFPPASPWAPSRWYVTNGSAVVGPVDTDLLLRGLRTGKVPADSYVAQPAWQAWRTLDQIREVRALLREESGTEVLGRPRPEGFLFAEATDEDRVWKLALKLAVEGTNACAGLVHRDLPPHIGLVTTHAYGRGLRPCLGRVVPWHDPSREAALAGRAQLDSGRTEDWGRAAVSRLSTLDGLRVASVALVSVPFGPGHRALIELGHPAHSFRAGDADWLDQLMDAVLLRLEQLAF